MATLTPNSEGFRAVLKLKNHKKAKTTPPGALRVKPEVKMELRFIFQLQKKPTWISAGAASQTSCNQNAEVWQHHCLSLSCQQGTPLPTVWPFPNERESVWNLLYCSSHPQMIDPPQLDHNRMQHAQHQIHQNPSEYSINQYLIKNYSSSTKAMGNPHRNATKSHDDHGIFDSTPSLSSAPNNTIDHLLSIINPARVDCSKIWYLLHWKQKFYPLPSSMRNPYQDFSTKFNCHHHWSWQWWWRLPHHPANDAEPNHSGRIHSTLPTTTTILFSWQLWLPCGPQSNFGWSWEAETAMADGHTAPSCRTTPTKRHEPIWPYNHRHNPRTWQFSITEPEPSWSLRW